MPPLPTVLANLPERQRPAALERATTVQMHSLGAAVRDVPHSVVALIARVHRAHQGGAVPWAQLMQNEPDAARRRRLGVARDTEALFRGLRDASLCRSPLAEDFVRMVLEGDLRSDTRVHVALTLANPSAGQPARYRESAVVAWGVSDKVEPIEDVEHRVYLGTRAENSTLNQMLRAQRVAEIDLVCASGEAADGKRGLGRALLVRSLAKIARATKQGERRFHAVITYLAHVPGGDPPLKRGVEAIGFKKIDVFHRADKGPFQKSDRKYYILQDTRTQTWEQQLARSVVWEEPMSVQCPLAPKSGRAYCA